MLKGQDFEYLKTFSLTEARDALNRYGREAALYAGGTDLLVQIRQNAVSPRYLIDLEGISDLGIITEDMGFLSIGALVTLREIERHTTVRTTFSALSDGARQVGPVQLRNTATIGGNLCQSVKCPYYNQSHINPFMRESIRPCIKRGGKICHTAKWGSEVGHAIFAGPNRCKASFGSNMAIALAVLEGSVVVAGEKGSRELDVASLYEENGGIRIATNEIITRIKIPQTGQGRSVFLQYKVNPAGYPILNAGVSLAMEDDEETCSDVKVWFGGVAPHPYEAKTVEQHRRGKKLNFEVIENASQLLFDGVRVSGEDMVFKVAKARVLCREALTTVFACP
jgi:xanthine dehydrogenase YagS FAD-binding subunit